MLGLDHPGLLALSLALCALAAAGFVSLARQAPRLRTPWAGALAVALALLGAGGLLAAGTPAAIGTLWPLAFAPLAAVLGVALALRAAPLGGALRRVGAAFALLVSALALPVALLLGGARAAAPAWPWLAVAGGAAFLLMLAGLACLPRARGSRVYTAAAGLALVLGFAALYALPETPALRAALASGAWAQPAAWLPPPGIALAVTLQLALLSLLLLREQLLGLRRLREQQQHAAALVQRQAALEHEAHTQAREREQAQRAADQRLEQLLAGANVGAFDWTLATGRFEPIGPLAAVLGHAPGQIEPQVESWWALVHPQDVQALQRALDAHLAGDTRRFACELRLRNAQRGWQWVLLQGQAVERASDGSARRVQGTLVDLDELQRTRQALQAERALLDAGPVLPIAFELEPPHRLRHGSSLQPFGGADAAAGGQALIDWVSAEDLAALRAQADAQAGEPAGRIERELLFAGRDGDAPRRYLLHARAEHSEGSKALRGYLVDLEALPATKGAGSRELQTLVRKMSASQRFMEVLQEMTELLQLCDNQADGRRLIARGGEELFPQWDGAITFVGEDGRLEVAASWGASFGEVASLAGDCWALKRGRLHHAGVSAAAGGGARALGPVCGHCRDEGAAGPQSLPEGVTHTLCVPLALGGERSSGVLHLVTREPLADDEVRSASWAAETLAHALKLSLANLDLRVSLREQAVHDWLTGLFNRRHFDEVLQQEVQRAERNHDNLTLALLDIDRFKSFNDAFGHDAGDEVIRAVAAKLHGFVRSYDVAARIGGEELAVLMPRAQLEETCVRLNRLREEIAGLALTHEGAPLPAVTVSIGVADLEHGPHDNLLQRADIAMYASKHGGRNRLTAWHAGLQTPAGMALRDEAANAPTRPDASHRRTVSAA